MKPTLRDDITVQSNMTDTQVIKMGIHKDAFAHIMSVLTDLYSNQTLAVIREYSTNALDAHVAAGVTRPIEVTLPSAFSPFFRVKDYGVGLSVDDVIETYSQYGASTKRESDDFNGMLGLGCKAALTYTPQFTVTAIKGGVKTQVIISRTDDGTAQAEIVDTCATNEGNGVEIIVPVKRSEAFVSEAADFYRWWTPGTILVNGKEPERPAMTKVAEGIFMVDNLNTDYVVMGQVAYPLNTRIYKGSGYSTRFGVVAFVNIGEVTFPPSREALLYNNKTTATVERIKQEFADGLETSIRKDVADAESYADAIARVLTVNNRFGYYAPKGLTYKGQEVPMDFTGPFFQYRRNVTRNSTYRENKISVTRVKDGLFITDAPANLTSLSSRNKEKIRKYADNNGIRTQYFLVGDALKGNVWAADATFVTWDDVMATRLNTNPATPRVKKAVGHYDVFGPQARHFIEKDLSTLTGTLCYFSPAEDFDAAGFSILASFLPDVLIVRLGMNRWEKFKRENPHALHVSVVAKEVAAVKVDALTDVDKAVMGLDYYAKDSVRHLEVSKIDDQAVVDYINLTKNDSSQARINEANRARVMAINLGTSAPALDSIETANPMDKYPLARNARGNDMADVYIYLNAKYATTQN